MSLDFNNDPWGAWGTLIGTILGQSYNKNAQERERAKADKIIDDMRNYQQNQRISNIRNANISNDNAGQVIANQMVQQAGAQGAQQATGLGNINLPSIDYMGQGAQYAEQQDPYQLSVPSPLEQLKGAGGKEYAVNKALRANQAAINNEKMAQAILAANPQAQAQYNWNPDYTEDNVRSKLRAADVRQEIIDEKVGLAKKDIAKRARDALMPSIITNLYGTTTTDANGNSVYVPPNQLSYAKAMVDLQTLAQYDPDTAKMYMSGAIMPKDLYNSSEYDRRYKQQRNDKREDAKQQHEWKREDTILANNLALERAKVNAVYKQSVKYGNGGLKMSDVKTLVELANSAIASDNPALQKQGEQILARAFTMLGDNNVSGSKFTDRDPDWNNYNDVMDAAHEALSAGGSKEQLATELKKHMGDGELYRKVLSDLGINTSKPPKPVSKPPNASPNLSLFPDWGSGERTGLVAALSNGGTVKSYFEGK